MIIPRFLSALAVTVLLPACGGGGNAGDTPSVTTLTASPPRYGQTMTIAVIGRNLSGIDVSVDGRCDNLVKAAGGADDAVQYTCTPRAIGEIVPRVRNAQGGRELGSVKVDIPLPRVSVAIGDGTRSGTFVIELDPVAAPATVDNFLTHVGASTVTSFYRNTVVTHADPAMGILLGGHVIGSDGALVGKPGTGGPITLEARADRKQLRGTVGMFRRGGANSATTEWFVNTQDNPTLDVGSAENPLGFAVFGRVIEGLAVPEVLAAAPTRLDEATGFPRVPSPAVGISAISQTR